MAEIWKPVPGYEGMYEASTLGRVRSVDRAVTQGNRWGGKTKTKLKGRVLKQNKNGSGYSQVVLSKEGVQKNLFVHRIVALTFIGEAQNGAEVCHNDGDKTNNRIDNLRYGTRKENMSDCKAHGTSPSGERNAMSKLSASDVAEIRRRYSQLGESRKSLGKKYGVDAGNIGLIVTGKLWKCVGGNIAQIGSNKGSDVKSAKLNESDIKSIRLMAQSGSPHKDIAKKFGVSRSCITNVINRKTWNHV